MYSKNIGIVGFVANLLSSITFTTCAPSLSKEKCGCTCIVFDQVFDDFEVSVKAGGSQGGRVGLGRRVDVRPALHQQPDYFQVACRNMAMLSITSIRISIASINISITSITSISSTAVHWDQPAAAGWSQCTAVLLMLVMLVMEMLMLAMEILMLVMESIAMFLQATWK